MNQLFDKVIDIKFYTSQLDLNPVDSITAPDTGLKPNITLSATFHPSDVVGNLEIRIVNYYPSVPLSLYKWMTVTAGYSHSQDKATISGQVKVAYLESPSPDGVTFISMIVGNLLDLQNRDYDQQFPAGAGLSTDNVINSVVSALSSTGNPWTLVNNGFDTQPLDNAGFHYTGKVIGALNSIKDRWKIAYLVEGSTLIFFQPNQGRTNEDIIYINYLSGPPQATASGITFTAPWNPKLRPGMIVQIDPVYFRQSFGGAQVTLNSKLITQTVSLQYNTVTNQNTMTVLALNTYEVPQDSGS